MVINPITAINQGWIMAPQCKTLDDWKIKEYLSPNAIDFDLTSMYVPSPTRSFFMKGSDRKHQEFVEEPLVEVDSPFGTGEFFELKPHTYYDFMSSFHVTVPMGVVALLIVRSSLNRNGIVINSGAYDQGFSGQVAGTLYNRSTNAAYISPGSRIGQIIFFSADDSGIAYAGGYNTKQNQHWTQV